MYMYANFTGIYLISHLARMGTQAFIKPHRERRGCFVWVPPRARAHNYYVKNATFEFHAPERANGADAGPRPGRTRPQRERRPVPRVGSRPECGRRLCTLHSSCGGFTAAGQVHNVTPCNFFLLFTTMDDCRLVEGASTASGIYT